MRRLRRSDLVGDIRNAVRDVERMGTEEVVDVGVQLHQASSALRQAMDAVKTVLRARAHGAFTREVRTVSMDGHDGTATLSAPAPIVRMAKDANVTALRTALGDQFGEFFATQVTPRPEAFDRVLDLPPEVREVVFRNVEGDIGAGAVGFTPTDPRR